MPDKINPDTWEQISKGISILKKGGIVAFPTDTVYGVGASAQIEQAVARIYEVKSRPRNMALPLLLYRMEQINEVAENISEVAWCLAGKYFPGALTLILKKSASILDIVTGGNHAGEFLRLLGNGRQFGLKHLNYSYQEGEGGIAEALGLANHFADNDKIIVVLGDNIIEKDIKKAVSNFKKQAKGARIMLKEAPDPERFGVVEIKNNKIISIEEKPKNPKSKYVVTGFYMYDSQVFDIIKDLRPSGRGELEITDVNNAYLKKNELEYEILDGWWSDAGTFDSLLRANNLVAGKE